MNKCDCCEKKGEKEVRVSFCPRCKSRSVGYVFGLGNVFGIIPKMRCRDCGFDSPTFPVLVASQDDIKRAVEGMKTRKVKRVVRRAVRKKVVKRAVKKKVVRRRR